MGKRTITYVAGPGDPVSVVWGNRTFVSGVPVEVEDGDILLERAQGNPTFNIDGVDKAAAAGEQRTRDLAATSDAQVAGVKVEIDAAGVRQEQEVKALEAKHARENEALAGRLKDAEAARAAIGNATSAPVVDPVAPVVPKPQPAPPANP